MEPTMRLFPVLLALAGTCSGCEEDPAPAAPTEPWPAAAGSAAPGTTEVAPAAAASAATAPAAGNTESRPLRTYRIQPGSILQVTLPAKEARPAGTFRIVRGTLELDLLDLGRSRGTVEVDLGSVLMQGENERLERQYTAQARDWLNLGASRPDAELERSRFARFVVSGIAELSHEAPHLGRRLPPADTQDDDSGGERRRVTARVDGELEANGFRVERSAAVQLDFHYEAPATPGLPPTEIRASSRSPLSIPLAEHEIEPRDTHGRLVAADLDLLGRLVGRKARVAFQLVAVP